MHTKLIMIVVGSVLAAGIGMGAGAESAAGATGAVGTVGTALRAQAGSTPRSGFSWPLPGFPTVIRPFDPPDHPYGPGHRGVDLGGWPGEPVLAAGAGVVAFAGTVAGKPVVSIAHPNGLRTTYEPAVATVPAGQHVARGQTIGTLQAGHEGCLAAACLHWGVRRGEEYLDPLWLLMSSIHVRLLPCDARCGDR
jgi:murein DD-endopeptidase MepM/ murein hydrolase activator NlpD